MPDFNRLVRRVSEAIGPSATAERVEAVARMVLDEIVSDGRSMHPSVLPSPPGFVVTLTGAGDPALRHAVEDAVVDVGGTIHSRSGEDSRRLLRISLGSLTVSIPDLESRLDALAARYGGRAGVLSEELFDVMNGAGHIR